MSESSKPLIVSVDDEPDILELISLHLGKAGYRVADFGAGEPMLAFLKSSDALPQAILLDLMLPDLDGLEICRRLRQDPRLGTVPILMLTARGEEHDKILGLELGADDYLVKPFSPRELVARIRALIRRHETWRKEAQPAVADNSDGVMLLGKRLEIDQNCFAVRVDGQDIHTTKTELIILATLGEKPGWVFSREKLLNRLWGDEKDVIDRTIDVHIRNLREKMGPLGTWIQNVRGVGYKLELP